MTTTANQALQIVRAIDWTAIGHRLDNAIRITVIAAELLLMVAALAIETIWEHRQQIRRALIRAVAALALAIIWCYRAGRWTRQAIHKISERSTAVLPQQPLPAIAPITGTLQAAREALARLVARLYPVPVLP
jgi:hypothetical protein